ncbi:hypothetical protein AC249_AIPGENE16617 [Exaiptasia diaphana]|nr:hypothetical protein AC249_AIPGENE16617 [Exaiptasia diaphana]
MSSRNKTRIPKYALFYFIKSKTLGVTKTNVILEGYRHKIKAGEYVALRWGAEKDEAFARIIAVHEEEHELWKLEREAVSDIDSLATAQDQEMLTELAAPALLQTPPQIPETLPSVSPVIPFQMPDISAFLKASPSNSNLQKTIETIQSTQLAFERSLQTNECSE